MGKVIVKTLEKEEPTRPRVSPEMLCPGSRTPFPAGHGVVKGACHKLLFIELDSCTSVGLDAVNTLSCAYIPQLRRQVI